MAIADVRPAAEPHRAPTPAGGAPGSPSTGRRIWAEHRGIVVLVAVAAIVRAMVWFAYRPGLTLSDSWTYIDEAFGSFPVGLGEIRPSGYPLLLRVLQTPVRNM